MTPSEYIPKPNVDDSIRQAASAMGRLAKGKKKTLTSMQRSALRIKMMEMNAVRSARIENKTGD